MARGALCLFSLVATALAIRDQTFEQSGEDEAGEDRTCIVGRFPDTPAFLRQSNGPEKGHCCRNKVDFYSCSSLGYVVGSEVYVKADSKKIGKVLSFDGWSPTVELKKDGSKEKLVSPYAIKSTSFYQRDPLWKCDCGICVDVIKKIELLSWDQLYIVQNDARIRTRGDFDPKVDGLYTVQGQSFSPDHKYTLFLYPHADESAVFAMTRTLCQRLSCWFSRGTQVVLRTVKSVTEAEQVLEMFPDRSLHNVVLGGHGDSDHIKFGDQSGGQLKVGNSKTTAFFAKLRAKTTLEASITLDSCLTAQFELFGKNFFEWVSAKMPGRHVVASKEKLRDADWQMVTGEDCLAGDTVHFVRDGQNRTAIAPRGKPACKDFTADDANEYAANGGLCLSRCGTSCDDMQKEWAARGITATLTLEKGEKDDRDSCRFSAFGFGRTKKVCRVR